MRYAKLLATLSGAGAVAATLAVPAQGAPRNLHLPMCHQTRVGSCSVPAVVRTAPGRNGRILFQGNVGQGTQLFSILPDGSGLVQVTHVRAGQVADGAWSADGTMIAYSHDFPNHGRGEIARADGSHPHAISPRRFQFAGDPDWLPDGRRLVVGALSADPSGRGRCDAGLRLVTAAGKLIRTITHQTGTLCKHEHWDVNADVSPDGRRIAFDASSPAGDAICVVGVNGRGRKCLTPRSEDAAHPVWSPDGTKILFQTHHDPERNRKGATANLFSIRPDGSDLTQITHLAGDGFYAGMGAWSPDGTQIVYHKVAPNDVDDLFLIDLDGGNERQLTHLGPTVHPGGVDWGTNQG
jgi:Tol biopolymer transport system component